MPTRNRTLKPDRTGRYRPCVGWMWDERKQPRFGLGTDKKEAERRLQRIVNLYNDNCQVLDEDCWSPLAYEWALQLAKGTTRILYPYPRPQDVIENCLLEYAQMLQVQRDQFPSLDIQPADPELYAESVMWNKKLVNKDVDAVVGSIQRDLRELGALTPKDSLPTDLISGTFDEALTAYEANIQSEAFDPNIGKISQNGRKRIEKVANFRRQQPDDLLLSRLNYDACKIMVDYWRNRPVMPDMNKPCSYDSSRHHLGELFRFFRWLDVSNQFEWVMPRGLEKVNRKIAQLDSDLQVSSITKDVYSVQELAILNQHATPVERLVLYLGINCAMGAAEMGRLTKNDFAINKIHPFPERLHFVSTDEDSFARYFRPKTSVFGEWLLWPETVELVEWGIERAKQAKSETLLVSTKGQPWYDEARSNPQQKFANLWNDLYKRVLKSHPDFLYLPFGSLRDTIPDLLRNKYEKPELASLMLTHGTPFKPDSLLECYGNKPFGKLHEVLREVRSYLEPVFAAAPDDPTAEGKSYLSLASKQRVREMLIESGGKKVEAIAKACEVSRETVYREKRKLRQ